MAVMKLSNIDKERLYEAAAASDHFWVVETLILAGTYHGELPKIKQMLSEYVIENKRGVEWPGTQTIVDEYWEEAVIHSYKTTKESVEILVNNWDLICNQESNDLDVSFFDENNDVLSYIINHEDVFVVNGHA